jgi:hypothetical protein
MHHDWRRVCPCCGSSRVSIVREGRDDRFVILPDRRCQDCWARYTPPLPAGLAGLAACVGLLGIAAGAATFYDRYLVGRPRPGLPVTRVYPVMLLIGGLSACLGATAVCCAALGVGGKPRVKDGGSLQEQMRRICSSPADPFGAAGGPWWRGALAWLAGFIFRRRSGPGSTPPAP